MTFSGRKATLLLFFGDLAVFALSLWLTLFLRYGGAPQKLIGLYVEPFAILFLLWTLVFYMAGLYSKQVVRLKSELWAAILRTQLLNIVLAALFFFLIPQAGITPKTTLAIYLAVSLVGIFFWRLGLYSRLSRPSTRVKAALVGSGSESEELVDEVNANPRYPFIFVVGASAEQLKNDFGAFARSLEEQKVSLLVIDAEHDVVRPLLPQIYRLAFGAHAYQFADFYKVYEEVFDRVPLSILRYDWFLKNVAHSSGGGYEFFKRAVDLVGGVLMGALTAVLIPFVWVGQHLEGKGPLFLRQVRIGQNGKRMTAYKFRTMLYDDSASSEWVVEGKTNRVTRLGAFLRRSSLDEFPQFINILRGELSLIGPRNDIAGLAERLAVEIPYYDVRYTVMPGITGWAQINQRYEPGNISPQSIEETKVRLAYDFYYIKNRSLALDLGVALKTFKRMLFRVSAW